MGRCGPCCSVEPVGQDHQLLRGDGRRSSPARSDDCSDTRRPPWTLKRLPRLGDQKQGLLPEIAASKWKNLTTENAETTEIKNNLLLHNNTFKCYLLILPGSLRSRRPVSSSNCLSLSCGLCVLCGLNSSSGLNLDRGVCSRSGGQQTPLARYMAVRRWKRRGPQSVVVTSRPATSARGREPVEQVAEDDRHHDAPDRAGGVDDAEHRGR